MDLNNINNNSPRTTYTHLEWPLLKHIVVPAAAQNATSTRWFTFGQ